MGRRGGDLRLPPHQPTPTELLEIRFREKFGNSDFKPTRNIFL
jgi:hypothetical protein